MTFRVPLAVTILNKHLPVKAFNLKLQGDEKLEEIIDNSRDTDESPLVWTFPRQLPLLQAEKAPLEVEALKGKYVILQIPTE